MAIFSTRSSLEGRLHDLERVITQARNMGFETSWNLTLERWLQLSDVIKLLDLDQKTKWDIQDGS